MEHLEFLSPAKINLFLKIVGKKPDGYHEICTLMCLIGLYDAIKIDLNVKKTKISCNHKDVPDDKTNLAYKAATLFFNSLKKEVKFNIAIDKKIPVGGGLGGGSSNAASVLMALNRFYGLPFSKNELMEMGLTMGADIPFFIFKKPAIATGIGEKLTRYNFSKSHHILLVNPGFSVSTAEVYKNLNLRLTKCKKKLKDGSFINKSFNIEELLCNDLETVTSDMFPDIENIKKSLMENGAKGALMSGSGPTVFGLFSDAKKARGAFRAISQYSDKQKFIADMII